MNTAELKKRIPVGKKSDAFFNVFINKIITVTLQHCENGI